jgi:hypothetical protein
MKKRLKIAPITLLVLLGLLAILVVKRAHYTAEDAEDDSVRVIVKLKRIVVRHERAVVAVLALMGLFAFVMWATLRANEGKVKATPPAGGPSASDSTAFR